MKIVWTLIGGGLLAFVACSRISDPAVKGNVDMLRNGTPDVQRQALDFFTRMGPLASEAIGNVKDAAGARNGDLSVRSAAILALPMMNPDGGKVLAFLRTHLRHPDPQIRIASLQAVGMLGPAGLPAADDVKERLKENDELVVVAAIYAIARIQPTEANNAALYQLLEVKSPQARITALRALGELAAQFALRLDPVRRALRDEDAEVQIQAVRTAGRFGEAASELIPDLQSLLEKQDRMGEVSEGRSVLILGALWRIDPSGVRIQRGISECLRTCRSDKLRMMISMTLPKSKAVLREGVDALLHAAQFDADPGVRQSSIDGLGKSGISEGTKEVLLRILVNDPVPAVSWKAAEVLGKMREPPATELAALAGTNDPGLRDRIQYAVKLSKEGRSPEVSTAKR